MISINIRLNLERFMKIARFLLAESQRDKNNLI